MICLLGDGIAKGLGSRGNVGEYLRIGDQLFLIAGGVKSNSVGNESKKKVPFSPAKSIR